MCCRRNIPVRSNYIEQRRARAHGTTQILDCYRAHCVKEECYRVGELIEPSRIMRGELRSLTPFVDGLARD
jgi:hypothetical protein